MLEKAKIVVLETQEVIPVMYNPTELSFGRTVHVQGDGAHIQFQRISDDDLTVALFFDSSDAGTDIRHVTDRLLGLTTPSTGTGVRREPPVLVFTWAGALFTGIITKLERRMTLFLPSGVPIRAEVTVTFRAVLTEQQEMEARGYYNCRTLWTVTQGDRLDLIAAAVLGDPGDWRQIAAANDIYDPIAFPTPSDIGRTLVIVDPHGPAARDRRTIGG
ncbi:peptidoglycan-binding protein LysM [Sphingomonas sp. Leaf33]|uniref:CIS tube protein n=1 Tax=Sphingomonas sp. Leaf33 TaxID=1736215 RepID=UPI0006FAD74E|nr:hypothetical protein [Sphingomonas sp. Leaf33]KQN26643.1 peptidoglycan-binding protein LysM [Sphingomonas sp. Leaf33]